MLSHPPAGLRRWAVRNARAGLPIWVGAAALILAWPRLAPAWARLWTRAPGGPPRASAAVYAAAGSLALALLAGAALVAVRPPP